MQKVLMSVAVFTLLFAFSASAVNLEVGWSALSPGGDGDPHATLGGRNALVTDASGNSVVTGSAESVSNQGTSDFLTIKYSPDGRLLWASRFHSPLDTESFGIAVAVDADDDVYVTGRSFRDSKYRVTTVKYSGEDGVQQWAKTDLAVNHQSTPVALAVDPSGDVIVVATLTSTSGSEFLISKYDGATGASLWSTRDSNGKFAADMAIDVAGNVVVAGVSPTNDYATIKYAGNTGETLWEAFYDGPGQGYDSATAIAIQGSDTVVVTGKSRSPGGDDFRTIRYRSSDGQEQWVATYDGPAGYIDGAIAIEIDASGDVVVAGDSFGSASGADFAVVKHAGADGQIKWVGRYASDGQGADHINAMVLGSHDAILVAGSSLHGGANRMTTVSFDGSDGGIAWVNFQELGNALALQADALGNVRVAGGAFTVNADFLTIGYAINGVEQWRAREVSGGMAEFICGAELGGKFSSAIDSLGNTIAAGCSFNGDSVDFLTLKFSKSGNLLWKRRYDGQLHLRDYVTAVAVDSQNNVIITGSAGVGNAVGSDIVTIKYTPAGLTTWVKIYDGPVMNHDSVRAIAVDSADNVYITGVSVTDAASAQDFVTIKYRGADGGEEWVSRYIRSGFDEPFALALSADGGVFVTGESDGWATVRYRASDGQQQWISRYETPGNLVEVARDLAVDASGDVFVTGQQGIGAVTLKYRGSDGAQLWQSSAPNSEGAVALAVDGSGNVFVATRRFGVLKYAGTNGSAFPFPALPGFVPELAAAMTLSSGNEVLVAGFHDSNGDKDNDFLIRSFDGTSGVPTGSTRIDFGARGLDRAESIIVAADGGVRVTGFVTTPYGRRLAVLNLVPSLFFSGFE